MQVSARTQQSRKWLVVTGEIFLLLGAGILLFMVWFYWLNDITAGWSQSSAGREISQSWEEEASAERPFGKAWGAPGEKTVNLDPPVSETPAEGEVFAVLYVPRFGDDFSRPIAAGVDLSTILNNEKIGIGHYPQSSDLGDLGNFAIAGHRTSFGAPFKAIDSLQEGDRLYVETEQGWHIYRHTRSEIVAPTAVDVLLPVPRVFDAEPAKRVLTLTTCHPLYSDKLRYIAYAEYLSWHPRALGIPAEIVQARGVDS